MQFLIPICNSWFPDWSLILKAENTLLNKFLPNFPNIFRILSQHIHTVLSVFCYDFTVQSVLASQHDVVQSNLLERKRLEFYDLGHKMRCILVLHRVFLSISWQHHGLGKALLILPSDKLWVMSSLLTKATWRWGSSFVFQKSSLITWEFSNLNGSPNIFYLKDNMYGSHNSKMRKSKEDRKAN